LSEADPKWRITLEELAKHEGVQFVVLTLFLVVTRIAYFVPAFYSIDDYNLLQARISEIQVLSLSQGRFGQAGLTALLHALGVGLATSPLALNLISAVLLAGSTILILRLWKITLIPSISFLSGALLLSHPYFAELWAFRVGPFSLAAPLFLTCFAITRSPGRVGNVVAVLSVAAAASVYQTALHFAAVAVLVAALLDIARTTHEPSKKLEVRSFFIRMAVLIAGSLIYLVLNRVIIRSWNIYVRPYYEATISNILQKQRLQEYTSTIARLFWTERALSTPLLNAVLLIALIGTVVLLVWALGRAQPMTIAVKHAGLSLILFAACILAIFGGLGFIGGVWWPAPRKLVAISAFWAGVLALGYLLVGPRRRPAILALGCVVLFAFIGINSHVASDQYRVNMRDFSVANRIVARLQDHPSFNQLKRIILINPPTSWPGITTAGFDLNISALAVSWAYRALIRESTGVYPEPLEPDDAAKANNYCQGVAGWPARESVTIIDGLGVICF